MENFYGFTVLHATWNLWRLKTNSLDIVFCHLDFEQQWNAKRSLLFFWIIWQRRVSKGLIATSEESLGASCCSESLTHIQLLTSAASPASSRSSRDTGWWGRWHFLAFAVKLPIWTWSLWPWRDKTAGVRPLRCDTCWSTFSSSVERKENVSSNPATDLSFITLHC